MRVCDDKNACHLVRKGQNRKDVRPVVKVDMNGRVRTRGLKTPKRRSEKIVKK